MSNIYIASSKQRTAQRRYTNSTSLLLHKPTYETPFAMPSTSTAATEAQILKSYLLNPASFPTIITFAEFQDLFLPSQQSHPQVKLLYRDLQFLRTVDTDLIEENIAKECRDGERQRREMYRTLHLHPQSGQKNRSQLNGEKDVQVDDVLYGQTGSVPKRKKGHTKESLFKEMEETIRYLEVDGLVARREADKLLAQMRETVGSLSDLRYGKFARTSGAENGLEAEVVNSLKSLEAAINAKSDNR
jgi:centromere-localized protein 2